MGLFNPFKKSPHDPSLFMVQEGSLGHLEEHRRVNEIEGMYGWKEAQDTRRGVVKSFLGITIPRKRWRTALILFFCTFFLFFAKAAHLQIIKGTEYAALAEGNRVRTHIITPTRGIVYDRFGTPLVENTATFTLVMTIHDVPLDAEERDQTIETVADLVGIHRTEIDLLMTEYAKSPFEPVPLKRNISYETAMRLAIETASLPGFDLQIGSTRTYPSSIPSLSHVLGYMGKINETEYEELRENGYRLVDQVGKTGVEESAESYLRGVPGEYVVEVDARGNELVILSREEPVDGSNIVLSIDAELQAFIEEKLQETLEIAGADRASIIVMDPMSGGVRALVSWPTYDSNQFAGGISSEEYTTLLEDENEPLFPRAVSGEFPSGSTFKLFVAYAALAERLVSEHTSFISSGGLGISQWYFPDWKAGGHGITDVRKAIAESVNTYFYIVGGGYDTFTGLGVSKITQYAEYFGFGEQTGIDLSGEADGFLPSKDWKEEYKGERWYVGDTYHLAIGQGDLLATPLQIATGTATIANGGHTFEPYLVEGIDGGAQAELFDHDMEQLTDLDETALRIVQEGMRQTVISESGSARYLQYLPEAVAGKTGTAQTPGDRPYHAWFTGYGPYEDPEIVVTVLVEEGGEGSSIAVPLARSIFEWWFLFRS